LKSGTKSLYNPHFAKPPAPSSALVEKKSKFKNDNKENIESFQVQTAKESNLSSNAALCEIENNFTAKTEPKLDRKGHEFKNLDCQFE